MPSQAADIGQSVIDRLKPMLDQAFDDVCALPGNPAERQNDALSGIATIGAFVMMQLSARLALSKGFDLDVCFNVALEQIALRARREISAVIESRR